MNYEDLLHYVDIFISEQGISYDDSVNDLILKLLELANEGEQK